MNTKKQAAIPELNTKEYEKFEFVRNAIFYLVSPYNQKSECDHCHNFARKLVFGYDPKNETIVFQHADCTQELQIQHFVTAPYGAVIKKKYKQCTFQEGIQAIAIPATSSDEKTDPESVLDNLKRSLEEIEDPKFLPNSIKFAIPDDLNLDIWIRALATSYKKHIPICTRCHSPRVGMCVTPEQREEYLCKDCQFFGSLAWRSKELIQEAWETLD